MSFSDREFRIGGRTFRLERIEPLAERGPPVLRDGTIAGERRVRLCGRLVQAGEPANVIAERVEASGRDNGEALDDVVERVKAIAAAS